MVLYFSAPTSTSPWTPTDKTGLVLLSDKDKHKLQNHALTPSSVPVESLWCATPQLCGDEKTCSYSIILGSYSNDDKFYPISVNLNNKSSTVSSFCMIRIFIRLIISGGFKNKGQCYCLIQKFHAEDLVSSLRCNVLPWQIAHQWRSQSHVDGFLFFLDFSFM